MFHMNKVVAKTVWTNQTPAFYFYQFSWLFYLILFFSNILDFISFFMLQTRSLYV